MQLPGDYQRKRSFGRCTPIRRSVFSCLQILDDLNKKHTPKTPCLRPAEMGKCASPVPNVLILLLFVFGFRER